jgi:hypothetical protein
MKLVRDWERNRTGTARKYNDQMKLARYLDKYGEDSNGSRIASGYTIQSPKTFFPEKENGPQIADNSHHLFVAP